MASDPQVSAAEAIAAQLRASIRRAHARSGIEPPASEAQPEAQIDFDLQTLRSTYDIAGAPFRSHRRWLGGFIILIKNFARELLVQIFARQSAYNGAAARSITHLNHRLNLLAQENARMVQRLGELEAKLEMAQRPSVASQNPAGPGGQHRNGVDATDRHAGAAPDAGSGHEVIDARGRARGERT